MQRSYLGQLDFAKTWKHILEDRDIRLPGGRTGQKARQWPGAL